MSHADKAKPLDPEVMNALACSLNALSARERNDFTCRTMLFDYMLESRFPGQDLHERVAMLLSFEVRLKALAKLRKQPEYKTWTRGVSGKDDIVDEALVFAAATQPLIENGEELRFEPKPFFEKVFQLAGTVGRA